MVHQSITIYTQPTCQACHRLKRFLSQKGIEYRERDIIADEASFTELQQFGVSTTPVILIGDEMIIGFDQVKLERLLSAPSMVTTTN